MCGGEATKIYLAKFQQIRTKVESPGVLGSISDTTSLLIQNGDRSGGREKMLVFNTVSIYFSL